MKFIKLYLVIPLLAFSCENINALNPEPADRRQEAFMTRWYRWVAQEKVEHAERRLSEAVATGHPRAEAEARMALELARATYAAADAEHTAKVREVGVPIRCVTFKHDKDTYRIETHFERHGHRIVFDALFNRAEYDRDGRRIKEIIAKAEEECPWRLSPYNIALLRHHHVDVDYAGDQPKEMLF